MNLRKVLSRPSLAAGILIIVGMFVVAMAAPIIAPPQGDDPYILPRDGFSPMPQAPSPAHRLGTMEGQGDVFYGLIWGTRMAFRLGVVIALGRLVIGVLLGLVSGAFGGLVDAVLMRITDAFLAFPIMAAVMVAVALFGAQLSFDPAGRPWLAPTNEERVIIITMILFGWMAYARLLRGNVLVEREKEYMQAATSTGTTRHRILFRHLLPNVTAGLFVLGASDIGAVVVWLAAFNFIGVVRYSESTMMADWGRMLALSRNWIIGSPSRPFEFWYTFVPASAAIVLFSIGWNLIGDGLRDLLDPRTRRGHVSRRVTR
jgi:peptide/nickel transport system permease protein